MDFGEVLTKAWKIVWRFKILWIFGIFAGCGTNRVVNFNGGSDYRTSGVLGSPPNLSPEFEDGMLRFLHFFLNPAVIAGFIISILVFICLAVFFSIVGRIGLIKGAQDADAGAEHLGFGGLWRTGLHYFWRILGLSLLIGSPVILIYLVLMVGAILVFIAFMSGSGQGSFWAVAPGLFAFLSVLIIFSCVIFLLAIVISFLSPQAERAIVIENEGVIGGIRRGWNVLTANLGPVLIIWLIVSAIGIVVGILLALPVLLVVGPLLISYFIGGVNASYDPLIIAGLCLVAYIPVSWVANGILTAYIESVWTVTYLRLTQPKPEILSPIALPNA
jgi:hypothetical protein